MTELFDQDTDFAGLGLSPDLVKAVAAMGFEHPTTIQAELIPPVLEGRDVLGQSRTGSGKTAAFGLPILDRVKPGQGVQALVLGPTRELAIQTTNEIKSLAKFTGLRVTAVYGGDPIRRQAAALEKDPEVVIGTPGRVMDLHQRKILPFSGLTLAVLDEVDRMLDIGFRDDIRKILGKIKQTHQTVFVSATISDEIEKLARSFMKDPAKIDASSSGSLTVQAVEQHYFTVEPWDKKQLLLHLLTHEEPALTVVFCRTKQTVNKVAEYLRKKNVDALAIHGDMYQTKRNKVMKQLRAGSLQVLIASDLAARGLDVDGISHVINYDLPEDPEVYVHRIGRTARAGRSGVAWSFVSTDQGHLLTAVEMLSNIEIPKMEYEDFTPGPIPADVRAERDLARKREEDRETTVSRTAVEPPKEEDAADATKFPGGVVPTKMPNRRMGGRLRTRRR